jgi:hypothetical protein
MVIYRSRSLAPSRALMKARASACREVVCRREPWLESRGVVSEEDAE